MQNNLVSAAKFRVENAFNCSICNIELKKVSNESLILQNNLVSVVKFREENAFNCN